MALWTSSQLCTAGQCHICYERNSAGVVREVSSGFCDESALRQMGQAIDMREMSGRKGQVVGQTHSRYEYGVGGGSKWLERLSGIKGRK
jgi:hypothetical protein